MRQPYLVVGALLVGLFSGASAVMAQAEPGRIPGTVVGSQGVLADKDQQLVVTYIEYWIKQLLSGDPEQIAMARGRLMEPYNQGGTEIFVGFYDQSLATRIVSAIAAKDVAGRMNTLIVARLIRHERVVDVVKQGLKDPSSAVVYQAAVAADALAKNANVAIAVKFGLRGPVTEALKKENSPFVLPYLYGALVEVSDPNSGGWEAAMTRMNERLAAHVASKDAGIDAELDGLRTLFVRLIKSKGDEKVNNANPKVLDKTLHQFMVTCVRYMELGVIRDPKGEDAAIRLMITQCDAQLQWAARTLIEGGAKFTPPGSVKDKPVPEVQLGVNDWKKVLKAEPFKIPDADLALPAAK